METSPYKSTPKLKKREIWGIGIKFIKNDDFHSFLCKFGIILVLNLFCMSLVMRKYVFLVSNLVRLNLAFIAAEAKLGLEI